MSSEDKESWERIGQHVIRTLERMEEKMDSLEEKINESNLDTHVEITALKVKAAVWGTIAGLIASAIISIFVGYIVYNITKGPQFNMYLPPKQQQEVPSHTHDGPVGHTDLLCPRDNERLFSIDGRTFIV